LNKNYQGTFSATLLGILVLYFFGCVTPKKGPKKAYTNAESIKPFDAIIVPGVPFNGTMWDSVMKGRVLWSYILYRNGFAKNVIYSGAAVYSPYKEAIIMGLYAEKLGIPAEHIFYDTEARHSTENVYYSYLLAQKQGFKTIALATDPFQSFLLRGFTKRRFSTHIYHLPFVTDSLKAYTNLNPKIDPAPAEVSDFVSITEKESLWQRYRGTLGKDIDWKKYRNGRLDSL